MKQAAKIYIMYDQKPFSLIHFYFLTSTAPQYIKASEQISSTELCRFIETSQEHILINSNQGQRLSHAFLTLIIGHWTNAETSLRLN